MSRAELTRTVLVNLLCCDGEDTKHFGHDLDNHLRHPCSHWDVDISLQPPEDVFDALEQVEKLNSRSECGVGGLRY
jgi:hypothetical protein